MLFASHALLGGIALYASAASAANHQVNVGDANGSLTFNPISIFPTLGDTVEFIFHPESHSVTESTFAHPCHPLPGGFDSGLVTVAAGTSNSSLPTRKIILNDTLPMWIHCNQGADTAASHCGKGMVFAVNPPGTLFTFAKFQAAALAIGAQLAANTTTASGSG